MRSHLATRSARLVLAVTATAALAAGLTACDSDDDAAAGGAASPSASAPGGAASPPASAPGGAASASVSPTGGAKNTSASTSGGAKNTSASTAGGSDGAKADGVGQVCGTNDLDFTVAKANSGGYLLITAKAQAGITCYLDGRTPLVLFSSAEKTKAYPAELMATPAPGSIKLSGSTAAYAALIPNTTRAESPVNFDQIDLTLHTEDSNTAHLKLPGSYAVDEAAVTNWYTTAAAATPNAN